MREIHIVNCHTRIMMTLLVLVGLLVGCDQGGHAQSESMDKSMSAPQSMEQTENVNHKNMWLLTEQKYGIQQADILDPKPNQFRFEHYALVGVDVLAEALSCMFPLGTPKNHIDNILIKQAGAEYKEELIAATTVSEERTAYKYLYKYTLDYEGKKYPVNHKIVTYFKNDLLTELNVARTGKQPCNSKEKQ